MRLFARLDAYGTDDPDFREGHPEDRCPLCERPVDEHPCGAHRRAALRELIVRKIDRALLLLAWH